MCPLEDAASHAATWRIEGSLDMPDNEHILLTHSSCGGLDLILCVHVPVFRTIMVCESCGDSMYHTDLSTTQFVQREGLRKSSDYVGLLLNFRVGVKQPSQLVDCGVGTTLPRKKLDCP